jgi:hypothetical protein
MRQYERKSLVLLEWDRWLQTQLIDPPKAAARDTLKFFCELQDRRSALLNFPSTGHDKWRVIHAWLLSEGRVFGSRFLPIDHLFGAQQRDTDRRLWVAMTANRVATPTCDPDDIAPETPRGAVLPQRGPYRGMVFFYLNGPCLNAARRRNAALK